jgi:hypothetical protein
MPLCGQGRAWQTGNENTPHPRDFEITSKNGTKPVGSNFIFG